jgi:hypothetical protein
MQSSVNVESTWESLESDTSYHLIGDHMFLQVPLKVPYIWTIPNINYLQISLPGLSSPHWDPGCPCKQKQRPISLGFSLSRLWWNQPNGKRPLEARLHQKKRISIKENTATDGFKSCHLSTPKRLKSCKQIMLFSALMRPKVEQGMGMETYQ